MLPVAKKTISRFAAPPLHRIYCTTLPVRKPDGPLTLQLCQGEQWRILQSELFGGSDEGVAGGCLDSYNWGGSGPLNTRACCGALNRPNPHQKLPCPVAMWRLAVCSRY